MFALMIEFKASLHIKNRQGLTPLTLAAKLARKEVHFLRFFYEDFKWFDIRIYFNKMFTI
jgi:hypothetical protein